MLQSPDNTPPASSPTVRQRMRRQRRRDTKPELELRRALFALGLRYRLDRPVVPGLRSRPDIVFGPAKVAVFVDGCFWHSCPEHATVPKNNRDWWIAKLAGNVERDRQADREFTDAGWLVIRVWEHEEMGVVATDVAGAVADRRSTAR